jgi:hypothetical protein
MMSESNALAHVSSPGGQSGASARENTLMAMSRAPLATPENVLPRPAAMPATCVPCRQSSGAYVHGTPEPAAVLELAPPGQSPSLKHASLTTFETPAACCRNGCALSTPVSRIATAVPRPSRCNSAASCASTMAVVCARVGRFTPSARTVAARPEARSRSRAAGESSSAMAGIVS